MFIDSYKKVENQDVLVVPFKRITVQKNYAKPSGLWRRTLLFHWLQKIYNLESFRPLILTVLTFLLLILNHENTFQNSFAYGLFLLGLIGVGIPHGAVDHLLESGTWNYKRIPRFLAKYLLLTALMGLIWELFPSLALIIFLTYSAWHFGQTDGDFWNFHPVVSFFWGCSVLAFILGTHVEEANSILASMGNQPLPAACPVYALSPWLLWALYRKQFSFALTILWLTLSSEIPLMFAFGLYFIGQHSVIGWQHIKDHLKMSHKQIWILSLPFHVGAWLMFAVFYFIWQTMRSDHAFNSWGIFFIFIACISFPHSIAMYNVYRKKQRKN